MRFLLIISMTLIMSLAKAKTINPTNAEEFKRVSVMVTNREGTSGGSGVILRSFSNSSYVLTNAHVCAVIKDGGYVVRNHEKFFTEKYKISGIHDICLIEIMSNLGVNTEFAEEEPDFGEKIVVSGFPMLYPLQIVNGMFSDSMTIEIVVGVKTCTKEDLEIEDPEIQFFCDFLGFFPIIREYNTKTTSAIISPGNSGSAVYNYSGEIVALVFAGNGGDLTQGFLVPLEYIKTFIGKELKLQSWLDSNTAKSLSERIKNKKINRDDIRNFKYPAIKDNKVENIIKIIKESKKKSKK